MRSLGRILEELKANQRKVDALAAIIKQGGLILEAKDQVEHGEWHDWLAKNQFSARTASRQMAAYEFAKKRPHVVKLKLSRDALYALAEGSLDSKVIRRALIEAKTKYVNAERVSDIDVELACYLHNSRPSSPISAEEPNDEAELAADPPPAPGEGMASLKFGATGEDDDFSELRAAVLTIERLTTKRATLFVGVRPTEALIRAADFLRDLANRGTIKAA